VTTTTTKNKKKKKKKKKTFPPLFWGAESKRYNIYIHRRVA